MKLVCVCVKKKMTWIIHKGSDLGNFRVIFGYQPVRIPSVNKGVCAHMTITHTPMPSNVKNKEPYTGCNHWVCRKCYNHFCSVCLRGFENNAHEHDKPCDTLYRQMIDVERSVRKKTGMSLCMQKQSEIPRFWDGISFYLNRMAIG
jgi:hypothetical protein